MFCLFPELQRLSPPFLNAESEIGAMSLNAKIFVSYRIDKNCKTISNPLLVPVRCGAVYDTRKGVMIAGDDTGDHISERRMTFNELTVQYWAWKNAKADYVGLCHYRRYMVFSANKLPQDPYGNVLFDKLNTKSCKKCGLLSREIMEQTIFENDILISEPYDVRYKGFQNLYEHYEEVPVQHRRDMEIALDIVREASLEYAESVEEYFNGTLFYPCNLFVMRWDIFDEYCHWLFPILFELEQRIDISAYDENECRVFGLLAERLLGAFFIEYIKRHPECRYKILQRALFWNTEIVDFKAGGKLLQYAKCRLKSYLHRFSNA